MLLPVPTSLPRYAAQRLVALRPILQVTDHASELLDALFPILTLLLLFPKLTVYYTG